MKKLILISSFYFLVPTLCNAAACCGGGFALPSIISGDDKAQITGTVTHSRVDTDVLADGVWVKRQGVDQTQTFKLEATQIFADRYQAGFSLPIIKHTRSELSEASGLADVSAHIGYEYLPDWDYHPFRPKGIGFFSLTAPTGKYDYTRLQTRGRGFWAIGAGTLFTKVWARWDANASAEMHHAFERDADGLSVQPGNGGNVSMGLGYNIQQLRLGSSIAWNYEDAVRIEGAFRSDGSVERFATASLAASYVFDSLWSATAIYSDQTLFGDPLTTTLSKSAGISLQKRWAR